MNWGSPSEFFAMGGYGLYVWGSYGVTLLALALEVWLVRRRARTPGGGAGRNPGGSVLQGPDGAAGTNNSGTRE